MAQQRSQRAGKAQPRAKATAKAGLRAVDGSDLQRECERLKAELEAARREIAQLRARQEQVLNRIDWVLDSLDTIAQTES